MICLIFKIQLIKILRSSSEVSVCMTNCSRKGRCNLNCVDSTIKFYEYLEGWDLYVPGVPAILLSYSDIRQIVYIHQAV